MALMKMFLQETPDTIPLNSIDWLSQPETFMSTLAHKLCRKMASLQPPVGSARKATNTKIEEVVDRKEDEVIVLLQSETQSLFQLSDDGSLAVYQSSQCFPNCCSGIVPAVPHFNLKFWSNAKSSTKKLDRRTA